MKIYCSKCKKIKEDNRIKESYCLKCQAAYNKKYRKENPDKAEKWRRQDYERHKERFKINKQKWELKNPEKRKHSNKKSMNKFRKNNPERFNELMMQNYRKNKIKWISRGVTRNILNGLNGFKKVELKRRCKNCKGIINLEIHHEIYPTKVYEIKKAIEAGKIYYLCKKHHIQKHSSGIH